MVNLREIELLGTLMRVGTATETARLLGMSQPGVSAQLKRLEAKLGITLFHRTANRLEATREANELFSMALPIFEAHAHIRSHLPKLNREAKRPVTISTTPSLIDGYLGSTLQRRSYQNWRTRLVLRVGDPVTELRQELADLGLQMAVPPKAEFQTYALGHVRLLAVMRRDHPLAAEAQVDCAQISEHALVCYDPDVSPMGATIRDAFAAQGLRYELSCRVPFCMNVNSMVRAGGGIGIIDQMTARDSPGLGLITKPVRDLPSVEIMAFHRRNEPLRASVQDFLSALLENIAVPDGV